MENDLNDVRDSDSHVVVVGGGQAAAAVVRTLRAEGHRGGIAMLSAERFGPYERPPLSKGVLLGTKAPADTVLLSADRLGELEVAVHSGVTAERIDRPNRLVYLDNGESIGYDKLVIATGGRPRQLELPGNATGEIAYLRTIDDALAVRERMTRAARVLVLGGGWIGLETACCARELGLEVLLVEACARLCERTVPPVVSDILLSRHRANGIDVRLATQIHGLDVVEGGTLRAVVGTEELEFDLVVAGVGMVANDELAARAGLPCANGVLCDAVGRTVDPDIFACGDVAAFTHRAGPARPVRLESWDNAERQGAACALALLGKEVGYPGLPWFWSEQGNTNLQILGFPDASRTPVTRLNGDKSIFFWLKEGFIDAAICVDAPAEMLVIKRLVQKRVPVMPAQLCDPSLSLKSLLQTTPATEVAASG
ncbi:FAD-dependent oxidoreductase [Paraburkholderia sp. IMGN_8]|uniref:NAD(P)/FAD-dependent oxidoreductase n=1 Tax=Paraburkholderia sp. IMGN_8 TaxID=3136564 RepID=UPI003101848A